MNDNRKLNESIKGFNDSSFDSNKASKINKELLISHIKVILIIVLIIIFYTVLSYSITYAKYILIYSAYDIVNPPTILDGFRSTNVFFIIMFVIIGIIKFLYQKLTPSLVNFIKYEIKNIGFIVRKNNAGLYSFLMTVIIFTLLGMLYFGPSNSYKSTLRDLYLYFGLLFLLEWGLFDDKLRVILKGKFYIRFDFNFKLLLKSDSETQSIRIYMTSNRLCWKRNSKGKSLFEEISSSQWFPRRGKNKSFLANLNPFLYFREYSEPINLQNQFLSLVLALKEWESKFS